MSKPKLGPWHPASVKPVHVGYYDVQYALDRKIPRRYWNGKNWSLNGGVLVCLFGTIAGDKWRGLAEKPA